MFILYKPWLNFYRGSLMSFTGEQGSFSSTFCTVPLWGFTADFSTVSKIVFGVERVLMKDEEEVTIKSEF